MSPINVMNRKLIRCDNCNSGKTRIRHRTKERICDYCGHIKKLHKENTDEKNEDMLSNIGVENYGS